MRLSYGRVTLVSVLALLALAGVVALVARPASAAQPGPRLLVPAYFDPPGYAWTTALSTPARTLLIANPDNGPGTEVEAAYRQLMIRARTSGHELLGYVHTSGGARPVASVETDMDRWAAFYGVHDIFFDEAGESAAELPYYRTLTRYARAHGARITVLNPGTVPARGYFDLGAIIVTFEDTYAAYRHAQFPAWLRQEPASRQANIVYAVPDAADAEATLASIHRDGVALGYVTGAGGDHTNPYAALPPYFGRETNWLS